MEKSITQKKGGTFSDDQGEKTQKSEFKDSSNKSNLFERRTRTYNDHNRPQGSPGGVIWIKTFVLLYKKKKGTTTECGFPFLNCISA